jgi:L-fuconolactonase
MIITYSRAATTSMVLALLAASNALAAKAKPTGGHAGPVVETHIHVYQVTRPGGVPWPPPANKVLYRDVRPADYEQMARKRGVIAAGIMEASPLFKDNLEIAEQIKANKFFTFYVAQLEVGAADFTPKLDELAKSPKCVGIRGFLWSPKLTLDPKQVADLKELARRGMTLDIISRGDLNPKDKVIALAEAAPDLRIMIDHLGGAKGEKVDPAWEAAIRKVAAHKNVFMKFSSFFDMFNPKATEDEGWKSPEALAAYKPHFDVLMDAFGPDRMIFGSNWPVVSLGGSFEKELALAEEYLQPLGKAVRDKVMYQNAQKFYRRVPPAAR